MRKVNFKKWIAKHVNLQTPYGDLARDVKADNNFIDSNDVEEIEYYMIQKSACIDCINVLHQAHTEYQEDCNN
tara:strand:- start:348 stop:566 length:219 start_codon:yes stop_codon:yes gene_type:complete